MKVEEGGGPMQSVKTGRAQEEETSSSASAVHASPEEPQQEIARRAYELYERRGRQEGHDLEDWLEAEREVLGPRVPEP
jgi:Protein of unknown function (DUF2934)